jgi:PKD repeat protein
MVGTIRTYKYRILNNSISSDNVQRAIQAAGIPDLVKFVNDQSLPVIYKNLGKLVPNFADWNYPLTTAKYGIIIFDGAPLLAAANKNTAFDNAYALGFSDPGYNSISVARFYNDDAWTFGNRLWHELNHTFGVDATQDRFCNEQDNYVSANFCNYIKNDFIWGWKNSQELRNFCNNYNNCNMCSSLVANGGACQKCTKSTCTRCVANNTVCKAFYTMQWEKMGLFRPISNFTASEYRGTAPLLVNFNNDTIGYGTPPVSMTYRWNFGDGGTSSDINTSHVFRGVGNYKVVLNSMSNFGNTTSSTTIQVTDSNPAPPPTPTPTGNITVQFICLNNSTQKQYAFNVAIHASYVVGGRGVGVDARSNTSGVATMSLPCNTNITLTTTTPKNTKTTQLINIATCGLKTYQIWLMVGA